MVLETTSTGESWVRAYLKPKRVGEALIFTMDWAENEILDHGVFADHDCAFLRKILAALELLDETVGETEISAGRKRRIRDGLYDAGKTFGGWSGPQHA